MVLYKMAFNFKFCNFYCMKLVSPIICLRVANRYRALAYYSTHLKSSEAKQTKRTASLSAVTKVLKCLEDTNKTNSKFEISSSELNKVVEVLMEHGVTSKHIKNHKNVLKQHASLIKANLLSQLDFKTSELLPLFALPLSVLRLAAKRAQEDSKNLPDRISYLCTTLNLEVQELISLLTKHNQLLTMSFEKLNSRMEILKNAPISTEDIVKDLWIFNYNEKLLSERILAAQEAKFSLKPWLLRCSKKHFNLLIAQWKVTQNILHGEDKTKYLARKLQCNEDYVNLMMKRNSLLFSTNIIKLEKVIELLYEKGYTPEEVRLFPKVFSSNVETLRAHFDEFQRVKQRFPTLPQISISKLFNHALRGPTTK